MDILDMKCTSCDEAELELYYCETCDQSDKCSNEVTMELLCESCISQHVRKGHCVKTSKGQVPLICADHKKLHNQYCKTCDITFCGKCLGNHSEHKMGSIDERAIEIKKEVFEMLTKLELEEKPLRAKKETVAEVKSRHESEQLQLKELFEKEIEEIRQLGLKRIDDNMKRIADEQKEVADGIDNLLNLQQRSRDLLAMTSPHLINDFQCVKRVYAELCENSAKALNMNYYFKSCDFGDVKEILDKMGKEVDMKLETVFAKSDKRCLRKFAVMGVGCSNFIFTVENGIMKIVRIKVLCSNKLQYTKIGELQFPDSVVSHYSIYDGSYLCSCIVFTLFGCVYRVNITSSNVCDKIEMKLPSYESVVCPFAFNKDVVHWCYWIEDRKVLKFSHNSNLEIQCSSAPRMRSRELGGYRFTLTTESNEIMIINPNNPQVEWIPHSKQKVSSIHQLWTYGNCLLIWDLETKTVTFMLKNNYQWDVFKTQKWHDSTKVISFDSPHISRFRFLPALECSSGDDSNNYVFMTLMLNE